MKNVLTGNTLLFEAYLADVDGTAVTTGTATITVKDSLASVVLSGVATHVSGGTYRRGNMPVSGWANGPITEVWHFNGAAGTLTQVLNNTFRVIGTDTIAPYIYPEELSAYYENIGDYFDGNEEAQVVDSYSEVNSRLQSMGIKLPFKVGSDGFYDQPLRDLNAYGAILRMVSKRQSSHTRAGEGTPWYAYFERETDRIYKNIEHNVYSFDRDISPAEGGVGQSTKTVGTLPGQMETNWRGGVNNWFEDTSFERDWSVIIRGTGTAGEVDECTYTYSMNGDLSNAATLTTSQGWVQLAAGVAVRFHRGTYTAGTVNLFAVNDKWTFKTFPRNQARGGKRIARSY